MEFPKFTTDLSIISKLGDNPGTDNGLSAEELKAKFDEASLLLQAYLNGTLVEMLNSAFAGGDSAPVDGLNMSGAINMNRNPLQNVREPQSDHEAMNLGYAKEHFVPNERTVNGKALATDIALNAADVGARSETWLPTIAEIGAAPSGYGLGKSQYITADALDSTTAPGWYYISASEYVKLGTKESKYWYITVDAFYDGNLHCKQIATVPNGSVILQRIRSSGEWGEWKPYANAIGALNMELLWNNASSTSSFAAQTIEVDLSKYDFVVIRYRAHTGGTSYVYELMRVRANNLTNPTYSMVNMNGSSAITVCVRTAAPYSAGVVFSDVTAKNTVSTAAGVADNARLVPTEIYGVKGVAM